MRTVLAVKTAKPDDELYIIHRPVVQDQQNAEQNGIGIAEMAGNNQAAPAGQDLIENAANEGEWNPNMVNKADDYEENERDVAQAGELHSSDKQAQEADKPIDNLEQQNAHNANGERPQKLRQLPLRFEYFGPGNPASIRHIIGEYAQQVYPLPAPTYLPPIPTYPPQMTPHSPIIPPYLPPIPPLAPPYLPYRPPIWGIPPMMPQYCNQNWNATLPFTPYTQTF